MAELTLHFETTAETDMKGAAAEIQKNLALANGIDSARSTPQRFQGIGPTEILAVVKIATTLAQSTAGLLTAIAAVHAAWKKARLIFPGLRPPTIEVGLKKVPIDKVTAEHVEELASGE